MVTSIRELVEHEQISMEETVYALAGEKILDFPMTIGDFFELKEEESGKNYFPQLAEYYEQQEEALCRKGLRKKEEELEQKMKELKQYPEEEKQEYTYRSLLEQLRQEKKQVTKEIKEEIRSYGEERKKTGGGNCFFGYKNFVVLNYLKNITEFVPQIKEADLPRMDEMPVLTTDLRLLEEAVKSKESIGIVGGPCLFGFDEMTMYVKCSDGRVRLFDFSSGVNLDNTESKNMAQYFQSHCGEIKGASFLRKKMWMTQQERNSISYLFELARVLGASVFIPLPDISYAKYLKSVVSVCEEPLREQILADFLKEAYAVSDLYLDFIDTMKQAYPGIEVTVLHGRSGDILEKFYKERSPYLEARMLKKATGIKEKQDAVVDYITMLAMPYYLGNVQHVLQVDSSDEADSARKCARLHQGCFQFHSLLYPEYLSADGIHTVFYAAQEYKDYMCN